MLLHVLAFLITKRMFDVEKGSQMCAPLPRALPGLRQAGGCSRYLFWKIKGLVR